MESSNNLGDIEAYVVEKDDVRNHEAYVRRVQDRTLLQKIANLYEKEVEHAE